MKKVLLMMLALLLAIAPAASFAEPAEDLDAAYKAAKELYNAESYQEAFPLLADLAEKGHAKAAYYAARCCINGLGMEKNGPLAEKYLQKALELNPDDVSALESLARLYSCGVDIMTGDPAEAAALCAQVPALCERAVALGSGYASYLLGHLYSGAHADLFSEFDITRAVSCHQTAAERGYSSSYVSLAALYISGKTGADGTVLLEKNPATGFEYLQQAEANGETGTYMLEWLGWFYSGNAPEVCPADHTKAVGYFEKAVELGSSYALDTLATVYLDGKTAEDGTVLVEKDRAKGFDYLTRMDVTKLQDTHLLDWLGWFYAGNAPEICPVDADKMLDAYTRSAELGSSYAMFMLGEEYRLGKLLPADEALARQWLTRAQEEGYQLTEEALSFLSAE